MNKRDELLHRITKANPVPDDAELAIDVVNSRPPLGLLINEGGTPGPEASPQRSANLERRWRGSLVAAGTAAAIIILGAASFVLLRTGQGEVTDPLVDPTSTTIEPAPATVVVSPDSWDPILATTTHGVVPPAAQCPAGSNPEEPGPADQPRPEPRWVGNLAAAFDQAAGRIVYVDVTGETWLFDVCTNTWHQPDPDGTPVPPDELYDYEGQPSGVLGQLVYDVDSDVTLALGWGRVSVYDADTNTWDQRTIELDGVGPMGAVYDPVSGLIITSTGAAGDEWVLWTYDVDTSKWTLLGPVTIDRDTPCCTPIDLLGYSDDLDRLILATHIGEASATLLVDPRSGETTVLLTGTPGVNLGWPDAVYGPADDTVYVSDGSNKRAMCGFDTTSLTWSCTKSPDLPVGYSPFAAAVGDPINDRLVLINRVYGNWWSSAVDDVWAINIDTGDWIRLLAPSVFTFAEDDLCEWVSEDEVTSFVRAAYEKSGVEWDGRAVAVPHQGSTWDLNGAYCRWEPTGGGYVIARGLPPWRFGGQTVEFSEVEKEGSLFPLGGSVSGHPNFADDIIVANAAFGRHGFWLQDSDEALGLEVHLPEGIPDEDWAHQEKMLSDVANSFLIEMGWTP